MRRLLALLFALCFILSSPFSGAFAAEIPTLDDMGIDPWSDLWQIQQTPEPSAEVAHPDDGAQLPDFDTMDLVGEGEITPLAFESQETKVFWRFWSVNPKLSSASSGNNVFNYRRYTISSGSWSAGYVGIKTSPMDLGYQGTFVTSANASSPGLEGYLLYDKFGSAASSTYDVEAYSYSAVYGNVVHFTNLGYDKFDGSLGVFGTLVSDIILGSQWSYNGKTWYGYSDSGNPSVTKVTYSFDGENFFDLPEGSTYDGKTGLIDLVLPIESFANDLYLAFYFTSAKNYLTQGNGQTLVYNSVFYKLDYSNLAIKAVKESESGVDKETKGLLATIIQWLTSIRDGIVNVASAIAALPVQIANLIIDGVKSLFIPREEDLSGLKDKFQALLSERLGFIWQAGDWILSFGSELLSAITDGSEAEFLFPGVGFDMNGEHYQLIEQQAVDFGSNGIVEVIRPFAGTISAFVVIIACINLFHNMVNALISGKNYFDFLKGGGD